MNRLLGCIVACGLVLSGCGGGTPYIGLWQCVSDPNQSLEIRRFEEYFIVIARNGAEEYKREGIFENEVFDVGTNNVGASMALELNGDEISCTKPPNFCKCEASYKKTKSLAPISKASTKISDNAALAEKASEEAATPIGPGILDRDPFVINLANGGRLQVFNDVRNVEYENQAWLWVKLAFHYVPHLRLEDLGNETFAEVRRDGDDVVVFFRVSSQKIDRFELMENVHKAVNTKIQTNNVTPIPFNSISITLPGAQGLVPFVVRNNDFNLDEDTLEVTLSLDSESKRDLASDIAASINSGAVQAVASIEVVKKSITGESRAVSERTTRLNVPIDRR